jgi:hypothetical protein
VGPLEPAEERPPVRGALVGERPAFVHGEHHEDRRLDAGQRRDLGEDAEALRQDWEEFAAYLEDHGQDPSKKDKVGATNVYIEPNADTETATERQLRKYEQFLSDDRRREYARTHYITGSIEDIRDRLQTYDDQGFDELVAYNRLRSLDELDRQLHLWTDSFPEYF